MTIYKLHNNSERDIGFCGRLARAGCGCPVPPAALKAIPGITFDPAFTLNDAEMFRSYRGVLAAMDARNPKTGAAEIDVFADGIGPKLTPEQLNKAIDEYRKVHGLPVPQNRDDLVAELEKSMNRPEDPVERYHRITKERHEKNMMQIAVDMMGQNMAAQIEAAVNKKLEELSAPDPSPAAKGDVPKVKPQAPAPAAR